MEITRRLVVYLVDENDEPILKTGVDLPLESSIIEVLYKIENEEEQLEIIGVRPNDR